MTPEEIVQKQVDNTQSTKMTMGAIFAFVLFTGLGLWINSIQGTINEVISMQPKMEQMRTDIDSNKQWQKDWQNGGELPIDVQQNEKIIKLEEKVIAIGALKLDSRLTRMETMLAIMFEKQIGKEFKNK